MTLRRNGLSMTPRRHHFYLLALVLLLVAGCDHENPVDPGDDDEPQATLSSIQANIFTPSCAVSGCHLGAGAPRGLDLSAGSAHANLVSVASDEVPELMLVAPGNPEDSYLVIKLEGSSRMVGQQMPRGRDPLSSEQIGVVRQWITNGAPDN